MIQQIVDSDGNDINSCLDYTIMMSNGSELGMTRDPNGSGLLADESPPNGGAIIEFSITTPKPESGKTWTSGVLGYIRGAYYEGGGIIQQYLYTFKPGNITHVGWTTSSGRATRFRAVKIDGNRVSLSAEISGTASVVKGIRLNKSKNQFEVDDSALKLNMACQFVKVETLHGFIQP